MITITEQVPVEGPTPVVPAADAQQLALVPPTGLPPAFGSAAQSTRHG